MSRVEWLTWYHLKCKGAMLEGERAKPSMELKITDVKRSGHKFLPLHTAGKETIAEKQKGWPSNLGQSSKKFP